MDRLLLLAVLTASLFDHSFAQETYTLRICNLPCPREALCIVLVNGTSTCIPTDDLRPTRSTTRSTEFTSTIKPTEQSSSHITATASSAFTRGSTQHTSTTQKYSSGGSSQASQAILQQQSSTITRFPSSFSTESIVRHTTTTQNVSPSFSAHFSTAQGSSSVGSTHPSSTSNQSRTTPRSTKNSAATTDFTVRTTAPASIETQRSSQSSSTQRSSTKPSRISTRSSSTSTASHTSSTPIVISTRTSTQGATVQAVTSTTSTQHHTSAFPNTRSSRPSQSTTQENASAHSTTASTTHITSTGQSNETRIQRSTITPGSSFTGSSASLLTQPSTTRSTPTSRRTSQRGSSYSTNHESSGTTGLSTENFSILTEATTHVNHRICRRLCQWNEVCKRSADGRLRCVPRRNQCGENETFNFCGNYCEMKCERVRRGFPMPPRACKKLCGPPACVCEPGFFRNEESRKCVDFRNCPRRRRHCDVDSDDNSEDEGSVKQNSSPSTIRPTRADTTYTMKRSTRPSQRSYTVSTSTTTSRTQPNSTKHTFSTMIHSPTSGQTVQTSKTMTSKKPILEKSTTSGIQQTPSTITGSTGATASRTASSTKHITMPSSTRLLHFSTVTPKTTTTEESSTQRSTTIGFQHSTSTVTRSSTTTRRMNEPSSTKHIIPTAKPSSTRIFQLSTETLIATTGTPENSSVEASTLEYIAETTNEVSNPCDGVVCRNGRFYCVVFRGQGVCRPVIANGPNNGTPFGGK